MSRAYWESDSMSPNPHVLPLGATPRQPDTDMLEWQVGINRALMDRLNVLEAEVKRLKGKVAYLEGATP